MIISESILTTFKLSIVFRGNWDSIENWLEPKNEPPSGNLASPISVKLSVVALRGKIILKILGINF